MVAKTVEPFTAAQVSKCQPVLASFLFPFKRIRLKKQKSEASVLSMVRILICLGKGVYKPSNRRIVTALNEGRLLFGEAFLL